MLKNIIIYRIAPSFIPDFSVIEQALAGEAFQPCTPSQERSQGWVPPRGEAHGPLIESVGGQWMLHFKTEAKLLPASVIARKVEEKANTVWENTGHRPGKREARDLKEEAKLDLLPQAFTRQSGMAVWIDPQAKLLVLNTSSQSRADAAVTALAKALPGLSLWLLDTQTAPYTAMAHWLRTQEPPFGFSIDRECELKSSDEDKSVVKYGRHPLDIAEISAHIAAGKMPTKLSMTWKERVSFVLTEDLHLKKLKFLNVVTQDNTDEGFDADVAIVTAELSLLIPSLIDALDGEATPAAHNEGAV